jgi:hypothetical protein
MRITYPDGTYVDHADCAESCPGSSNDSWTASHPSAKFPDCRTEALYSASLDWQPESTGDVDGFGIWACILHFPVGEYLTLDGEYPQAIEGPDAVWIPAGAYVLCSNDQGFVWIEASPADGHGSAQARFAAIEAEYSAWCDQDEDSDDA